MREELQVDKTRLMYHVDRGIKGFNQGLSNGMKVLNTYLHGTHKGRYYLLGADSGVGKTTLGDFMYFYSLYQAAKVKGIELKLDYYSFEISMVMKKARLASLLYYEKYKQNLPASYILGEEGGLHLTAQEYAQINIVSQEIEELFDHINFVETPLTPTEMWTRLVHRAEQDGELIRNRDKIGRASEIIGYKPGKDVFRMTIIDHLALLELERGMTLKQSMDTASTYFVRARNLFGDSFLVIQQFNSEMQGAARERKSTMAYVPTRLDFGDSKYTFRDADVVMGLTRPADFQLNAFGAYTSLEKWGNYFLLNFVMKNRYGRAGDGVPMFLNPIAGYPVELPTKDWNLLLQQQYIEKAEELDEVCRLHSPKTE